jgi:hypothetical protein
MTAPVPNTPAFIEALRATIWARLMERSPWRRFLPVVIDPAGVVRGSGKPGGRFVTVPAYRLTGPSTLPPTAWLPSDGSAPTFSAQPTWTTTDIAAHGLVAVLRVSDEFSADFRRLRPGAGPDDRTEFLWGVADLAAEALALAEDDAFINGSGSTSDPIVGLKNAGLATYDATGKDVLTALQGAIGQLRRAKRVPTAAVIGPAAVEKLRLLRDSAGAPIFPPDRPLIVDDVPVYESPAIAPGATSTAFVIDGRWISILHRPVDENLNALGVALSRDGRFGTDEFELKVKIRVNLAPMPQFGKAGILQLTNVATP